MFIEREVDDSTIFVLQRTYRSYKRIFPQYYIPHQALEIK